jgi:hypothetical protein
MRTLIIGAEEKTAIARVIEFARANPIDARTAMAEAARDEAAWRDKMMRYAVKIPIGFRVCYSHEIQPKGIFRHISISVDRPKKMPSEHAVALICDEFGIGDILAMRDGALPNVVLKVWIEDVSPGEKAINILALPAMTEHRA